MILIIAMWLLGVVIRHLMVVGGVFLRGSMMVKIGGSLWIAKRFNCWSKGLIAEGISGKGLMKG